jgi:hypothetical protein
VPLTHKHNQTSKEILHSFSVSQTVHTQFFILKNSTKKENPQIIDFIAKLIFHFQALKKIVVFFMVRRMVVKKTS